MGYKSKLTRVCENICEEVESLEEYKRRIYEIDDELLKRSCKSRYVETYNRKARLELLYNIYLLKVEPRLEYINAESIVINKGEYLIYGAEWLLYKHDGLYKLTNRYEGSYDIIKDAIMNGDIIDVDISYCRLYKVNNPLTVKCLGIANNIQMTFHNPQNDITHMLKHKDITNIINNLGQ